MSHLQLSMGPQGLASPPTIYQVKAHVEGTIQAKQSLYQTASFSCLHLGFYNL